MWGEAQHPWLHKASSARDNSAFEPYGKPELSEDTGRATLYASPCLWQDKPWGLREHFVYSLGPDLPRTDCQDSGPEGPIFWSGLGASASSRLQTPTDANTATPSLCVRGIDSARQAHGPPSVDSLHFPFPADSLGFLTSSTIPLSARQHSPHFNAGGEPVHIDVPIESQLLGKLGGQQLLDVRGEVAQGIP